MTDPLDDPDVTAAMKLIGAGARRRADLCPSCGAVDLEPGEELCRRCTERAAERARDRTRTSKSEWWREQADYPALRAKHGARAGAERWIYHRLRKRPDGLTSRELWAAADAAGIKRETFRRARRQLRKNRDIEIERRGNGPDHTTVWKLTRGQLTPSERTSSGQ